MYTNDLYDSGYSARVKKIRQNQLSALYENADKYDIEKPSIQKTKLDNLFIESSNTRTVRDDSITRFRSFSETVRNCLVVEALYKMYSNAIDPVLKADQTNRSIMRKIVTEYVNENGYNIILANMRKASVPMCEMYNVINNSINSILEDCDQTNPDTFVIKNEDKDQFFNDLDCTNTEDVEEAISDRVSNAMADFINTNNKDHEEITNTLKNAQEKIDTVTSADDGEDNGEDDSSTTPDGNVQESYQGLARARINKIRTAPKGVFHSMVSALSESVLKHDDMHNEFMTEGHLDMDKIVDRTRIMYTFMEMLNTSRLDKVDEAFISEAITNLSK